MKHLAILLLLVSPLLPAQQKPRPERGERAPAVELQQLLQRTERKLQQMERRLEALRERLEMPRGEAGAGPREQRGSMGRRAEEGRRGPHGERGPNGHRGPNGKRGPDGQRPHGMDRDGARRGHRAPQWRERLRTAIADGRIDREQLRRLLRERGPELRQRLLDRRQSAPARGMGERPQRDAGGARRAGPRPFGRDARDA